MSYGTADQVASLARVWTDNGSFTADTNPTDTQVDEWLDQVSSTMDAALAMHGFITPVTQVGVVKALTLFVVSICADLCHAANSSGRFFTENVIQRGLSPMLIIRKEINAWVDEYTTGFEAMGAATVPSGSPEDHVFTRTEDEAGERVVNLFQRKGFGDRTQDWDR